MKHSILDLLCLIHIILIYLVYDSATPSLFILALLPDIAWVIHRSYQIMSEDQSATHNANVLSNYDIIQARRKRNAKV